MALFFYRYRHKWAHGLGSWGYDCTHASNEKDFWVWVKEEQAEELQSEYSYSDKYRGINIEVVNEPPIDWLRKRASLFRDNAKYYAEMAEKFETVVAERG